MFERVEKVDGPLSVSQVKQIGGRAGRYGSEYPNGLVTTYAMNGVMYLSLILVF